MRYLGNFVINDSLAVKNDIESKDFPVVREDQITDWGLTKEAFWADFRPRANFSVLRKMLLADLPAVDALVLAFLKLVAETNYSSQIDRMFLMKCFGAVATHVDPPYRDTAFNWYPFPTPECTLVFETQRYTPKQGDILLLDVTKPHRVDQNTDEPVYIMSL